MALAAFLSAQSQSSASMSTVNTDPLSTQNVFATEPPVLQSNLVFEKNNLGQLGTSCYGAAATSTIKTCYTSSLPGSQTILNQSASKTFTIMILTAAFAGAPTNLGSAVGNQIIPLNSSEFSLQVGAVTPNSKSPAITAQYNNGDFSSVFIRMSDYFGGLNCGSNPGGSNCLLKPNVNMAIPYSFVSLPANVIFSVNGANASEQSYETDPSTSTSAVLAALISNPGGTFVPEPGTLLLAGGGVLSLLKLRSRRGKSPQALLTLNDL
jgi:hypothetical protein